MIHLNKLYIMRHKNTTLNMSDERIEPTLTYHVEGAELDYTTFTKIT